MAGLVTTIRGQPRNSTSKSAEPPHPYPLPSLHRHHTPPTKEARAMNSLRASSRAALRARSRLLPSAATTAAAASAVTARAQSTTSTAEGLQSASYKSPFASTAPTRTTKIPDFSKYRASDNVRGNQLFSYFMVGTMGALSAAGAKAVVQGWSLHPHRQKKIMGLTRADFLVTMAASADVLAMAKVEVDLSSIPEGKNVFPPSPEAKQAI